jgi:hypothetical protein
MHTSDKLHGIAGLHDIVIDPKREHEQLGGDRRGARKDEDRDVPDGRKLADLPTDIRAVAVRKGQIQHHDIGRDLGGPTNRALGRGADVRGQPGARQVTFQRRGEAAIVFDDEDGAAVFRGLVSPLQVCG